MSGRSWVWALVALGVGAAGLGGCVDEFDSPTGLLDVRLLAGRVEVVDDPTRAWPRLGERTRVTWLVAGPEGPPRLSWTFIVCPGGPPEATEPLCSAAPFAIVSETTLSALAPSFEFEVPEELPEGVSRLLVSGILCADGMPRVEEETFAASCVGANARELTVFRHVTVTGPADGDPNRNPSLADAVVTLAGGSAEERVLEEVDSASVPLSSCREGAETAGLPVLRREGPRPALSLRVPLEEREVVGTPPTREALEVSLFVTAGELEFLFAVIEGDAEDTKPAEWDWGAAGDLPEDGRLVRFIFVARDGRGGAAWTERSLCLTP